MGRRAAALVQKLARVTFHRRQVTVQNDREAKLTHLQNVFEFDAQAEIVTDLYREIQPPFVFSSLPLTLRLLI